MNTKTERIDTLAESVAKNFRCFGGGNVTLGNPISHALASGPAMFAAGVDVKEVVRYLIAELAKGAA